MLKAIFSFLCIIALTLGCEILACYLCSPILDTAIGKKYPFIYGFSLIITLFLICYVIFKISDRLDSKKSLTDSHPPLSNPSLLNNQISHNALQTKVTGTAVHSYRDMQLSIHQSINPIAPIKYTEESIHAMDWRQFELFIAQILREHDYVAHVTPATSDGGKDIIARSGKVMFYIECKHWKKKSVGREELQKLVGAAASSNIREIIFITSSNFTDTGISYKYELNRIGKFHLQLWSMRDILTLANHTDFSSIRPLRTLEQRQDRISARDDFTVYYSFGHPSNRCSISSQYGNIYIDDQNRFSHMPCQYFHITKAQDFSLSNIFFEEIRNPERPDLICFYTEKRGRLGDLRIIGCYGGRIQELFNPYVGELDGIGENCTISIKYVLGETFLVVSGSKNALSIKWNGSEYILG